MEVVEVGLPRVEVTDTFEMQRLMRYLEAGADSQKDYWMTVLDLSGDRKRDQELCRSHCLLQKEAAWVAHQGLSRYSGARNT